MKLQTTVVEKFSAFKKAPKAEKCIICLPGAGRSTSQLCTEYGREIQSWGAYPILIMGFNRDDMKWYDSVDDILESRNILNEKIIEELTKRNLSKQKTYLVGFSSGGVMALDALAHSDEAYAGGFIHAGAILDENFPECKNPTTEIILAHNQNDPVFTWEDSFLPMESLLKERNYKFRVEKRPTGGHSYNVSLSIPVIMNRLVLI